MSIFNNLPRGDIALALWAQRRAWAVVILFSMVVSVLLLTSSSDPADRHRAAQHTSVRGFMNKPLDKDTAAGLVRLIGPR